MQHLVHRRYYLLAIPTSLRLEALETPSLQLIEGSAVNQYLSGMRIAKTGTRPFRDNMIELSKIVAQAVARGLPCEETEIQTPLAPCAGFRLAGAVALVPILTAASPMEQVFWDTIPNAEHVYHTLYYRDENDGAKPVCVATKLPEVIDPALTLVILDPMLASAGTLDSVVTLAKKRGAKKLIYAGLIASPEGVLRMGRDHPDVRLYTAALDSHLNEKKYIVPGLGDAGDRAHGRIVL